MRRLFWIASVMAFAGCGEKSPQPVKRDGQPDVLMVSDEDPRMATAIAKSRETIQVFVDHLKSPRSDQTDFAIKVPVTENGKTEHLWLKDVSFDGEQFKGIINNEPLELRSVKIGELRTVRPAELSDWMFVEAGILKGGYSIRALRNAMPAGERQTFDANVPFRFD